MRSACGVFLPTMERFLQCRGMGNYRRCVGGGTADRPRVQGKRPGRPRVGEHVEQALKGLLAQGMGLKGVVRETGVGILVLQRVKPPSQP